MFVPWTRDAPYDPVVSPDGEEFLRVQCKSGRETRGCIAFNTHATDHGSGPQLYHGRADIFAVYSPTQDQIYVLDVADLARCGWLRLEPTRNNQVRGVRMAADHTIDRWIEARERRATAHPTVSESQRTWTFSVLGDRGTDRRRTAVRI